MRAAPRGETIFAILIILGMVLIGFPAHSYTPPQSAGIPTVTRDNVIQDGLVKGAEVEPVVTTVGVFKMKN